jgi:hypothetical protein
MRLVQDGADVRVEGPEADRASVAWARADGDDVALEPEPVRA